MWRPLLERLHGGIEGRIAKQIANAALADPLISGLSRHYVAKDISREELTILVLELGAADSPQNLRSEASQALYTALVQNGVCQDGSPDQMQAQIRQKLKDVRAFAMELELAHRELSNGARTRIALLRQANSEFLAKINLWLDQALVRASRRFSVHERYITFYVSLALALVLQFDITAAFSRLLTTDELRKSLMEIAQK